VENDVYCKATIYATNLRQRMMTRRTDIDNPGKVKEYWLALLDCRHCLSFSA
jgi:hypothetical protein